MSARTLLAETGLVCEDFALQKVNLSARTFLAETGFVCESFACGKQICLRELGLRKLDLSVCEDFALLTETGFAYEMDSVEFQDMCTEDLSRWMRDKGVQDCYCEVFEGEYVICIYVCICIICTWCHKIFLYVPKNFIRATKITKYIATPFEQATVS